jgi:DNA-binding beta-propeller fold protein YncE
VTVDPVSGDVFVSDTGTDLIHRLVGGVTPQIFLQDVALNGPNGLFFDQGQMFITNFNNGRMLVFDPAADPSVSVVAQGLGNPDGLEKDGQSLLTTDFNGRLISITGGVPTVLVDQNDINFDAAADLGFDPVRRIAAVPELFGTEVNFIDLNSL